jgi:adenosylcobinamide-GDP ribazoletransferase
MIKQEIHIFLTAVMFYSRIPCPSWVDHNPTYISRSTKYLPVIGWIVGVVYACAILIFLKVFSPLISLFGALAVSVLLTGAFHEDGFADVCDGFGGGWTKEKILGIMKDSRVGTYGVVGLFLLLGTKIFITLDLLSALDNELTFALTIISSHTLSRMTAISVIFFQSYARDETDQSKAKPVATGVNKSDFMLALLFSALPFSFLILYTDLWYLLIIIVLLAMTSYLMRYFKKWIGGYTGDCLGATQQVNEVIFLLTTYAVWKFI